MYEDEADLEDGEGSSSPIQQDGNPPAEIPLHDAIKTGNIDAVNDILDTDADSINLTDADGNSALHIAALEFSKEQTINEKAKFREIIKALLENGAEKFRANNKGKVALEFATIRELALSQQEINLMEAHNKDWHAFLSVCKILIPAERFGDKGASLPYYEFGSDQERIDAIRKLVQNAGAGSKGALRSLLPDCYNYLPFVKANEQHGPSLLHLAARNSAVPEDFIEALIAQDYDVNAPIAYPEDEVVFTTPSLFFSSQITRNNLFPRPDDEGMTPLHVAALYENYNAMQFLIRSRANVNATVNPTRWTPYSGWTPYLLIAQRDNANAKNMLNYLEGDNFNDLSEGAKIERLMTLCGAKDSSFDDEFGFNLIDRCVLFSTHPLQEIQLLAGSLPLTVLAGMFKFTPYEQLNVGAFQNHESLLKIKNHYGQDIRPRRVSKTNQWSELIHNNANFHDDNEREKIDEHLQKVVNEHLCVLPVLKYFANAEVNEVTQRQWDMFRAFINKSEKWKEVIDKNIDLTAIKNDCIATQGFAKTVGMISAKHKAFIKCMEQLVEMSGDSVEFAHRGELNGLFGESNLEDAKAVLAHFGDAKQASKQAIAANGDPGPSSSGTPGFSHSHSDSGEE